ncbi:Hyaluronidase-4 [Fukomys damarensis]|uniref:Hyaluronidase n=1 Tax=Fukomys damarensis TaxID=885580 RepID=A0A091D947_FUKDA|nr:Hyaluronidase-4 [Fukomys damarensis]
MKLLPEGQFKICIIQSIHLTSWLIAFLNLNSVCSLKPAQLPMYQRKPFIAAWNTPTDQCLKRYNIRMNLQIFQVTGSTVIKASGQNVTIFYPNRLGYYPWYTSQGVPINGGIPQNMSLKAHLKKAGQDIDYYIPAKDFSGLAIIDWEYWRPQWARNWNAKDVYRQKSKELISDRQQNVKATDIEYLAKANFEESAKKFMMKTIKLGIKKRPKGLWGYYLYPDCHNYNMNDPNYTGSCPEEAVLKNNELSWLWNSSAALYPSISIKKSFRDSEKVLHFSKFRLHESMRISAMTSHEHALPVFVYTRLGYRDDPLFFLSQDNCTKVNQFLSSDFGRYIVNVSTAAEVCSLHLCRNNGRCVRKTWNASHYLHLNNESYHIELSKDGEFSAKGYVSDADLAMMKEKFFCHCYQGYKGADCQEMKEAHGSVGLSSCSGSPMTLCLLSLASYQNIQVGAQ